MNETLYELFKRWAGGDTDLILSGTKDHHALDAIRRFELFRANMARRNATHAEELVK